MCGFERPFVPRCDRPSLPRSPFLPKNPDPLANGGLDRGVSSEGTMLVEECLRIAEPAGLDPLIRRSLQGSQQFRSPARILRCELERSADQIERLRDISRLEDALARLAEIFGLPRPGDFEYVATGNRDPPVRNFDDELPVGLRDDSTADHSAVS